MKYYDGRLTDGATQSLPRPWSRYGQVTVSPSDGRVAVMSIPKTTFGRSLIDTTLSVTADNIQTVDGVAAIAQAKAVVPKFGVVLSVPSGTVGNYTLQGRLQPQVHPQLPVGLSADLAYVTAEHVFAAQLRKIVDKSLEWPLRQAAVLVALGLRIAHDRGDRPQSG